MFQATLSKTVRLQHKELELCHEYKDTIDLTIEQDKERDNGFCSIYQFVYDSTTARLDESNGAQCLINLMKDGYEFDSFLPENIINALIEPAAYLVEQNRIFGFYQRLEVSNDNLHLDDSETYYHKQICDCNAPLIEKSYYVDDKSGQSLFSMVVHVPTANTIVNCEGKLVRAYRSSVCVKPDRDLDYDDLQLICIACGRQS